jgi:hypothetical protein
MRCVSKDEAMNWTLFEIPNLESSEQQQDQQDDDDKAEAAAAIVTGAVERSAAYAAKAAEQRDNKNNKNDCSYGHVAISSSPAVGDCCSAFGIENKWQRERFHCCRWLSLSFFGDDWLLHGRDPGRPRCPHL